MEDIKKYIEYAYYVSGGWTNFLNLSLKSKKKYEENNYEKFLLLAKNLQLIEEMKNKESIAALAQEEIEELKDSEEVKEKIGFMLFSCACNSLARINLLKNQPDKASKYFHRALEVYNRQAPSVSLLNIHEEFQKIQLEENNVKLEKNKSLKKLYKDHKGFVSDKWLSYLDIYNSLLFDFRGKPISLLEIGVQNGGSLEIWGQFFPNAINIIGCDINEKCAELNFADSRISVFIGDINSDKIKEQISKRSASIDIIIDDGSHRSSDIIKTFEHYYPYLAEGGVYIAEDLHCSYWEKFEGGLFAPHSSIAFFKQLIDVINHEHWGVEKYRADLFEKYDCHIKDEVLESIHSICFYNSLCIIKKEKSSRNFLGRRFVAGSFAKVSDAVLKLHASHAPKMNERKNPWTKFN